MVPDPTIPTGVSQSAGLIVVDHGSKRGESNDTLLELVRQYRQHSPFEIIEPAHMELAEPSIQTAVDRCIKRGASMLIVQPFFLLPGRHWHRDIPQLVEKAVQHHDAIKYMVTAPIGIHKLMFDILNDRVQHCLQRNIGDGVDCDVCNGSGDQFPCQLFEQE